MKNRYFQIIESDEDILNQGRKQQVKFKEEKRERLVEEMEHAEHPKE